VEADIHVELLAPEVPARGRLAEDVERLCVHPTSPNAFGGKRLGGHFDPSTSSGHAGSVTASPSEGRQPLIPAASRMASRTMLRVSGTL
jgi:hypothetical protein